ncbi:MAG: TGS domain-containing protein, partial [Hyphomonadaceae bacterium]|nr:TGS domain-containing protein [Hyphomonadaceae bacterium]
MSIQITFPDGKSRDYAVGVTGLAIAESISKSLAKKAVSIFVDGCEWDLMRPIEQDAAVRLAVRDDPEGLELIRHDAAHVLAQAIQELFPGTQITIGPNIEDGFFYDIAPLQPLSLDDLPKLEQRMREIVDRDEPLVRELWNREDAVAYFKR